jgi:hypothetical protein
MPNLSIYYKQEIAGRAVPLLLPLLQTCLTISVYATVAIALTGMTYVRPAGGSAAASTTITGVYFINILCATFCTKVL